VVTSVVTWRNIREELACTRPLSRFWRLGESGWLTCRIPDTQNRETPFERRVVTTCGRVERSLCLVLVHTKSVSQGPMDPFMGFQQGIERVASAQRDFRGTILDREINGPCRGRGRGSASSGIRA
jgi:hypothetical protein